MNEVIYNPPQTESSFLVTFGDNTIRVKNERSEYCNLTIQQNDGSVVIQDLQATGDSALLIGTALEALFSHNLNLETVYLKNASALTGEPLFAEFQVSRNEFQIPRIRFFQLPYLWLRDITYPKSEIWMRTGDKLHPLRSKPQPGVLYRRFIPSIQKLLSFRTIDIDQDLEVFHRWHNKPRVYDLWELNKSKEELRDYLVKGQSDNHQIGLILEFDGIPAGYFELYWAAEDRISPFCDATSFDRGFHFLIGEDHFLGVPNTSAVVESVSHFLFLDDPRTRRIVAEPRADNKRVIKYASLVAGWSFVKEFDFPHKRAALLTCVREGFFMGQTL